HGGYREIISRIAGRGAFSRLKFESGTHRVQRVPATEAQGRIHTSTCTVAILPELDEVGDIGINPADLRVDTYRSSGAGGQHVNKTDSAVRITHLPSGIVVECQDERSQHKNRSRAMALLRARLLAAEQAKQQSAVAASRRLQVGSGDRSERIRTYNFPQGRGTDHRINLTLYKLPQILDGQLDELIEPPVEDLRELVEREIDAVIGDPPLREVVSADSLGAIAATDLQAARCGNGALLLRLLGGEQPRPQQRHGARAVLVLGALVLTLHHDAARQMGDAHRGIGLVDVLAAGARGTVGVDAKIRRVDPDITDLVQL